MQFPLRDKDEIWVGSSIHDAFWEFHGIPTQHLTSTWPTRYLLFPSPLWDTGAWWESEHTRLAGKWVELRYRLVRQDCVKISQLTCSKFLPSSPIPVILLSGISGFLNALTHWIGSIAFHSQGCNHSAPCLTHSIEDVTNPFRFEGLGSGPHDMMGRQQNLQEQVG